MQSISQIMLPFELSIFPPDSHGYIVGGSIRDLILGFHPIDYDITVPENPENFARLLAHNTAGHFVILGKSSKKVYRVITADVIFDVTPFRGDTIESDLRKRDFTINAMAYCLSSREISDPFNGLKDIVNKIVQVVNKDSFRDDPIRLLRAYRMSALFGFKISLETEILLKRDASLIQQVAGERIHDEFLKILSVSNAHRYIQKMYQSGLLFALFPELRSLSNCTQNHHHCFDVLSHSFSACAHLEKILPALLKNTTHWIDHRSGQARAFIPNPSYLKLLKFALLFHDIGKPDSKSEDANGRIHFFGHDAAGAVKIKAVCERLRFSRKEIDFVSALVLLHSRPRYLYQIDQKGTLTKKAIANLFKAGDEITPYLLLHAAADMLGKGSVFKKESLRFLDFLVQLFHLFVNDFKPKKAASPFLTGKDLIQEFGLSPSLQFRILLDEMAEAQLIGEINNRDEALEFIRRRLGRTL